MQTLQVPQPHLESQPAPAVPCTLSRGAQSSCACLSLALCHAIRLVTGKCCRPELGHLSQLLNIHIPNDIMISEVLRERQLCVVHLACEAPLTVIINRVSIVIAHMASIYVAQKTCAH